MRTCGLPPRPIAMWTWGRRASGCWTTSTSSRSTSARYARVCPRGYYRELPELAGGTLAGYPRVYEIAITLISHTEGRIELENVELFVAAFQQTAPLSIGELWAVPAMLRLGLIENVRRMALRTVHRLDELESADACAERLVAASAQTATALDRGAQRVRRPPADAHAHVRLPLPLTSSARWASRCPPWSGSSSWITDEAMSAEDAAARATQRVALTQIMMANSITSLRAIARMEWDTFVERQSAIEPVLREDPAGAYGRMTFATRDQYRHVVERIAKRTRRDEAAVAQIAVDLARAAANDGATGQRSAHVGYYLVDHGLAELERLAGYRPTVKERLHRWVLRHPNVVFVGGIMAGTAAALAALLWLAGAEGRTAALAVALLGPDPGERHRGERDQPARHRVPPAPGAAQAGSGRAWRRASRAPDRGGDPHPFR